MVGTAEYVLAMMLPSKMPWSESDQGESFWSWADNVFSPDDSWRLWCFMREATGSQQDEYVTAYPTKANSHPLMKHQKGFDAQPPDTFPYHPNACVKLILRNVRTHEANMPSVILQPRPKLDMFWCAVQAPWLAGMSAQRDSMMRSHPNTLQEVLAPNVRETLLGIVRTNLANVRQALKCTVGSGK